jgi:pyridoxine 5-phosphate synthase
MQLLKDVRPDQATLVPDPPDVLTSNAGWDTVKNADFLKDCMEEIHSYGIRSSIFIAPDVQMIEKAKGTGTQRVELYTEAYAKDYSTDKSKAIAKYVEAANAAFALGIGLNAGHDLNLENLRYFKEQIPGLAEVSIGHALISDALYFGLSNVIPMYKRLLQSSS